MRVERIDGQGNVVSRYTESVDVNVSVPLTRISQGYSPGGFVADEALPQVTVESEKFQYPVWGREAFDVERSLDTNPGLKREDKGEFGRAEIGLDWEDEEIDEYGLETLISDRERRNEANGIDLDSAKTKFVTWRLLLAKEARVAALLTDVTNITQNVTLSGTSQWDEFDEVTSTPVDDVETGIETIQLATGEADIRMICPIKVWRRLRRHPQCTKRYENTESGHLTTQQLAEVFGVSSILVPTAAYNTANPGQTQDNDWVWGNHVVLLTNITSPGLMQPAAGYQAVYQKFVTERYREERRTSDVIRVREASVAFVSSTYCAYLLKDVM